MACVFSTSLAILSAIYPPSQRGSIFGINVAVVYIGSSFGPVVGGIMTAVFGWRSLYLLLIPLALLSMFLVYRTLKFDFIESRGEPFDTKGALIYMVFIFFLLFGLSNLPEIWAFACLAIGLLGFPILIYYLKNQKYPIMKIRLFFTNKHFARSNFAALLNYAGTFSVIFFLSLYLQRVADLYLLIAWLNSLDLPVIQAIISYTTDLIIENDINPLPILAGLILLAQPVVQATLSPFVGKLSDKIDSRYLSTLGMLFLACGLLCFSTLKADTPIRYLIAFQIIVGTGFALFASPNTSAIMNSVSKRDFSSASSTISVMRQSGMVLSMAIAMCIISIYLGSTEMLNESTIPLFLDALKITFYIGIAFCLIGAILSYLRGPTHRGEVD
jgi:MFS family permease